MQWELEGGEFAVVIFPKRSYESPAQTRLACR